MNAQETTGALNGKWLGHEGRALCPVCGGSEDNKPLSIKDGLKGPLIYCHKSGCDFRSIANALRDIGLGGALREQNSGANLIELRQAAREDIKKKSDKARRCWLDCRQIDGSPASNYLESRGLKGPWSTKLGCHPACWHGPSAHRYPAMVGLVEGGDGFAVHRTYLGPDCRKAAIAPNKLSLGSIWGGAVRLAMADTPRLIVGEGIESTLSFAQIDGRPAHVWAALSTSGMKNLRLPPETGQLVIVQDGDAPGREAAQALARRAHTLGWKIKVADPGDGRDFNDILAARTTAW